MNTNFGIIGVAGYIAPRHLRAIKESGCNIVAATDPFNSVGILDSYSLETKFFQENECFYKYIGELQNGPEEDRVHWVSVCSPNYLHSAHIRMSLLSGANVICEKPLVLDPNDLDMLQSVEEKTGKRVYTILQLRLHPKLIALKQKLLKNPSKTDYDVLLTYITARGPWYNTTWKGNIKQSGGVITNIGIHLLDLMVWLFGNVVSYEVHLREKGKISGVLRLDRARVRWFLSTDISDLSFVDAPELKTAHREILLDKEKVEFSGGFTDLHTRVYTETLLGTGFDINTARPSIELAGGLLTGKVINSSNTHPIIKRRR